MAGHVANLATMFEDPPPIRSRFMSHNVSRWLPLKKRTRPCACAESRDPCVGGQNNYIFGMLDPDLPIHYATSVALR